MGTIKTLKERQKRDGPLSDQPAPPAPGASCIQRWKVNRGGDSICAAKGKLSYPRWVRLSVMWLLWGHPHAYSDTHPSYVSKPSN